MYTVKETLHEMAQAGWTVGTVAEGLGVSRQSVNRWWRGGPEPEQPQMVLMALGVLQAQPVPAPAKRGPKPRPAPPLGPG